MADTAVSEYMKIRRYVVNLIYKARGKSIQVPTILELAKQFGVSHATVSKAMKELTTEGFIIGRRGIGSFTNPRLSAAGGIRELPVIGILMEDGMGVHFDKYLAPILGQMLQQLVCLPATVHLLTLGALTLKLCTVRLSTSSSTGSCGIVPRKEALRLPGGYGGTGSLLFFSGRKPRGSPPPCSILKDGGWSAENNC